MEVLVFLAAEIAVRLVVLGVFLAYMGVSALVAPPPPPPVPVVLITDLTVAEGIDLRPPQAAWEPVGLRKNKN